MHARVRGRLRYNFGMVAVRCIEDLGIRPNRSITSVMLLSTDWELVMLTGKWTNGRRRLRRAAVLASGQVTWREISARSRTPALNTR
ncbi:hypothetical protein EVAR_95015_1 [Eumeta japonica]|uniref:Uncharacterized protein n=1 Tax=Eumeta variegata TaxID=151549 RepID=A0A4C1VS97_EUMVA|nr:hypothetical protein EVAR_95015_1 [Eumeta japonica]